MHIEKSDKIRTGLVRGRKIGSMWGNNEMSINPWTRSGISKK